MLHLQIAVNVFSFHRDVSVKMFLRCYADHLNTSITVPKEKVA